ncbi:MAG TPA: hypothetical protein VMR79_03800 [Verrucomicrobiae bacterium]|nr:hypothetical protein [Verrucomicrobiae bacterium]
MRIVGRGMVVVTVLAALLAAGAARADNNPNGMVFRAAGWFRGKSQTSQQGITCEIPTLTTAIADGVFEQGLWNTFGFQTLYFPDVNNPFGNPCGVWLELQNNLLNQAIQVDHVALHYKILGARRFRQFVPARNAFPIACRQFHNDTIFIGAVINPINSNINQSGAGAPNVTLVQMVPFVSPQLISCLRDQYAPLSTDLFTSLSLVIRATVFGVSDTGDSFQANPINYTLNLRHTCGNGRIDDGEECDPNAPTTCFGFCVIPSGQTNGTCSNNKNLLCLGDSDCHGVCSPPNNPTECVCVY